MTAGYDIYALKGGTIPAQRQLLVDTGIAIGLPRGTYGRLVARSGMASKHGIAVGGGVIDAEYTSEVKVFWRNYEHTSYEFKAGDRIAELIVETIQIHDAMEIDNLENTDSGTQGFGSSDLGPELPIRCEDLKVKMSFLNSDPGDNSYFDEEDIHTHTSLRDEITMLSSAIIAALQMQTMEDSFLERRRAAGKEDNWWRARKGELRQLKERGETLPKHWQLEDELASGTWQSVVQGGPECSWSTKGGRGPRGPPGPLRSPLIHTFSDSTENVDQEDQGDHNPPWWTWSGFYILLMSCITRVDYSFLQKKNS